MRRPGGCGTRSSGRHETRRRAAPGLRGAVFRPPGAGVEPFRGRRQPLATPGRARGGPFGRPARRRGRPAVVVGEALAQRAARGPHGVGSGRRGVVERPPGVRAERSRGRRTPDGAVVGPSVALRDAPGRQQLSARLPSGTLRPSSYGDAVVSPTVRVRRSRGRQQPLAALLPGAGAKSFVPSADGGEALRQTAAPRCRRGRPPWTRRGLTGVTPVRGTASPAGPASAPRSRRSPRSRGRTRCPPRTSAGPSR